MGAKHPIQKIAIRIDSNSILYFDLKNSEINLIKLALPLQVILDTNNKNDDILKIEIESFNPIEPSKLGIGEDRRLLSIGLISATFQ